MRKKCIILLFLTSTMVSLFPYEFSLGNNLLVMNLFSTIENTTSYGFNTTTPLLGDYFMDLDYSMHSSNSTNIRVDEANILLGYTFNDLPIVEITTKLGLNIAGDLSATSFNNLVEKITESEDIERHLRVETLFSRKSLLYESDSNSSELSTDIFSNLTYTTSTYITIDIGSALIFQANNFHTKVGYLYGYNYNYEDNSALSRINNLEDEGIAFLSIRAGHIQYDLNLLLNGSFSRGRYSIIFGELPVDTELEFIDLKLIVGTEYDIGSDTLLNSMLIDVVPMNWFYSRFDLSLLSSYGRKKPQFINSDLEELYYSEAYYNKIILLVKMNLFENDSPYWINPFVGIGGGVENFHYYGEDSSNSLHTIPVYTLNAGCNILLPQIITKDNVQYGLHFSSQYRGSLNHIRFKNSIMLSAGLTVALEL